MGVVSYAKAMPGARGKAPVTEAAVQQQLVITPVSAACPLCGPFH